MKEIAVTYGGKVTDIDYAIPVINRVLEKIGQQMVKLGIIDEWEGTRSTVWRGANYHHDQFSLNEYALQRRKILGNRFVFKGCLVRINMKWIDNYVSGIIERVEVHDVRIEPFLSKALPIYYDRFKILDNHPPVFIKCYDDYEKELGLSLNPIEINFEKAQANGRVITAVHS